MHGVVEVQPGNILRVYEKEEVAEFRTKWMGTFARNKQGVGTNAYLWHIFSSGRYPSVSGEEALTNYRQQVACEYIVLCNERAIAFATDRLPERCSLRDYYVSPYNLAWTMAFTHEDGWLGPYFARHGRYAELNEANMARLRKLKGMAAARVKGWC